MEAMRLEQVGSIDEHPLVHRQMTVPEPGRGEVRVRVHCCAICRTDLHIIEGDLPQPALPVTPGHQVVGTIDQCGPGVTDCRPDDRVGIAWLRSTDGTCLFCQRGQENLCQQSTYTGYHADGGYAGYAVAPADYVYKLPESFNDEQVAPLLCAGLIGYRAMERAKVPEEGRLLLVGFGSSAHIVMQLARHRGYTTDVLTRSAGHQAMARELGAAWVGDNPADLPKGVDSAVYFAPVGKLVPPVLELLRPGGTLSIAGIHLTPIPSLDYQKHLYYEKDIRSVTANTRDDGRALLEEAAKARVQPHLTVYPLSAANEALQAMKHSRLDGTAVLRVGS
jgi:propanol-preferring alcohol dehydrogenase